MHRRFTEKVALGDTFLARLMPGDDVFERLEEILSEKKLQRMVILSAIGSLKNVSFRDLKDGIELPITLDKTDLMEPRGPFELLSLEGNVVPMEDKPIIHLHAMLGTPDGTVIGGHLFKAVVCSTLEILLGENKGIGVLKGRSAITNLTEMYVPG